MENMHTDRTKTIHCLHKKRQRLSFKSGNNMCKMLREEVFKLNVYSTGVLKIQKQFQMEYGFCVCMIFTDEHLFSPVHF